MTRALLPGRWSRDKSRAVPVPTCLGACAMYGRPCTCQIDTELANATPPDASRTFGGKLRRGQVIPIRPAITVHRIPLRRRVKRFLRALRDFLAAPHFHG